MDHLLQVLQESIRPLESFVLAFSGGVDSSLVLRVAVEELGDAVLAVTGRSASMPAAEAEAAARLAARLGARHMFIETDELASERYLANPPDRCYYCKHELYQKLKELAQRQNLRWVCDGTNADDQGDYRPGLRAARECGVRSPLAEAGLGKREVRALARRLGLPNWAKPAEPCLASRIPYYSPIDAAKLRQVEEAEGFLHALGFPAVRVRHHGDVARIEVPADALPALADEYRRQVTQRLRELGFRYVTLDLEGLRSGSLNETLPPAVRSAGAPRST